MPKKIAPSPRPQTHFELVPLELVVKIAAIDTPFELTPALAQPVAKPLPPESPKRTKR
jgi:hypothetical protein